MATDEQLADSLRSVSTALRIIERLVDTLCGDSQSKVPAPLRKPHGFLHFEARDEADEAKIEQAIRRAAEQRLEDQDETGSDEIPFTPPPQGSLMDSAGYMNPQIQRDNVAGLGKA